MICAGPFIPYIVTVIASNAFGNGNESSVINFTRQGGQYKLAKSNYYYEKSDITHQFASTLSLS